MTKTFPDKFLIRPQTKKETPFLSIGRKQSWGHCIKRKSNIAETHWYHPSAHPEGMALQFQVYLRISVRRNLGKCMIPIGLPWTFASVSSTATEFRNLEHLLLLCLCSFPAKFHPWMSQCHLTHKKKIIFANPLGGFRCREPYVVSLITRTTI